MPFELGQSIRAQVGSASVAAMELAQPAEAQERTLDQIAADIVRKDQQVGLGLISIGNDLIEAKERVEHGKWREWLDLNVGYSERKAQMCMQVARRYGSNPQLVADLGIRKVTALMLLPSGEDAEFLETHDVPNMSTRELKEAIRERDEAKAAAEKAAADAQAAEESRSKMEADMALLKEQSALDHETADKLRDRVRELENRPVDVAVQVDEEAVKKAADEARAAAEAEWSAKVKEAEDKLAKAKEKAEKAEEKAKKAGEQTSGEVANLKAEAEQLRAELERAKREQAKASISGDADLAAFQLLFEDAQTDINKMRGILLKVRGRESSELGEKLTAALLALAEKVKECAV